ncbi:MAG: SDR family NAD(P)-dependent oxidoreductase [Ilumatobacteraceae bacterium]
MKRTLSNVLDATVVGGFSRVGYEVRSRALSFARPEDLDLRGRRIVVTGPTSGLGRETARMLATAGADLVLVGRDRDRTDGAAREVEALGAGSVETVLADMGDLEAVASASRVISAGGRVDALVHNAGALLKQREVSPQGFEATVASHVLGPFLMTRLLVGALSSSGGRVVTVSSGGMYAVPLPRVAGARTLEMGGHNWDGTRQYAIAKRAQVTLNEMWAVEQPAVWFAAMHPGWADTPGVKSSLPLFRVVTKPLLRTARQGADTIAWLAGTDEPGAGSGAFWCDREVRPIHRLGGTRASDTPDRRRDLWRWCTECTDSFVGQ